MAKQAGSKNKILYLLRLLWEKSDEEHAVSMTDILGYMERNGISAERKSIYSDIAALQEMGFDIMMRKGKEGGYFLASRGFELAEIKILADSVQASRFLSEKKSRQLLSKLSRLCSEPEARQIEHQVHLLNPVKGGFESIYYSIDTIHRAIAEDKIIRFRYFDRDAHKEKVYRYNGSFMKTNPVALVWDDEFYYLVAYDSSWHKVRNYRVDRMEDIEQMEESRRCRDEIDQISLRDYTSVNFSMYNGKRMQVSLVFREKLMGVMYDRFGTDITVFPQEEGWYAIHPVVAVSPQFFGWLFGLGESVRLTGPGEAVSLLREQWRKFAENHDYLSGTGADDVQICT